MANLPFEVTKFTKSELKIKTTEYRGKLKRQLQCKDDKNIILKVFPESITQNKHRADRADIVFDEESDTRLEKIDEYMNEFAEQNKLAHYPILKDKIQFRNPDCVIKADKTVNYLIVCIKDIWVMDERVGVSVDIKSIEFD